ncbi:hypothetical protein JWZ98_04380 [Methylomonas sp. EFPC1]|uniref:hypothetical protein n=1 Tax=unclassified Methylomonas TaxID=2608980 RepID=UPI0019688656|nr:hypothetical protein [Methylomonas sp. EFPC1]QSB02203.1 hypothetical protein JWZ98_04380 [Methylomonas sp. EFPC1]
MSQLGFFEERVLFSPDVPEEVNKLLQMAVAASHADKPLAEKYFRQAQALDATCLQTYFALYKFYFYQGRLLEAELEVMAALNEAARQGGFPADYRQLGRELAQWDMYASEVALFYLYSLKALAFIKLRRQLDAEAQSILVLMRALDPEDRSGASVIMDLADAVLEDAA